MEAFEYSGIWWLPNRPEIKVQGILKFHPNRIGTLELIGQFENFTSSIVWNYDIILGLTANGKIITLSECTVTNAPQSFPGFRQLFIDVNTIFVGVHFETEEAILFDALKISYAGMEEWVNISGFSTSHSNDSTENEHFYSVAYDHPSNFELQVDDAVILLNFAFSSNHDISEGITLKQTTFFEVQKTQATYKFYDEQIFNLLQNFLSLGMGRATYPIKIWGKTPNNAKIVEVFYAVNSRLNLTDKLSFRRILYKFSDIAEGFSDYLKKWFQLSKMLEPVYDIYFGIVYDPQMYVNVQFLLMAQALEAYYGHRYGGKFMSKEEYDPIYEALITAIPEDIEQNHKASLEGRIRYGYEYSLRKKLKLIFDEVLKNHAQTVNKITGKKSDFISKLVDTRNYLTHFDEESEKLAIKDDLELIEFNEKMKLILQMCFLIELEIPSAQIQLLIDRNGLFQFWIKD